jgi:hypothetical protein
MWTVIIVVVLLLVPMNLNAQNASVRPVPTVTVRSYKHSIQADEFSAARRFFGDILAAAGVGCPHVAARWPRQEGNNQDWNLISSAISNKSRCDRRAQRPTLQSTRDGRITGRLGAGTRGAAAVARGPKDYPRAEPLGRSRTESAPDGSVGRRDRHSDSAGQHRARTDGRSVGRRPGDAPDNRESGNQSKVRLQGPERHIS